MTYKEFKDKYNGKYIDYDGQYGSQCWDLAEKYFTECLKLPASVLGGCGLVSNMLYPPKRKDLDKYFDEVPTTDMHTGDTVIWEYGHIAIFDHWDGKQNWYFSQNPNPCQVMTISKQSGVHAFRLKGKEPSIAPPVERDTTKDQLEVIVDQLRVRTEPSLNGKILGFAQKGFYNVLDKKDADGYTWYKIADNNWVAYSEEWEKYLPKEEDYKKLYEDALKEIESLKEQIQHLNNKINLAIRDLS